jgi:hypothetical protein
MSNKMPMRRTILIDRMKVDSQISMNASVHRAITCGAFMYLLIDSSKHPHLSNTIRSKAVLTGLGSGRRDEALHWFTGALWRVPPPIRAHLSAARA